MEVNHNHGDSVYSKKFPKSPKFIYKVGDVLKIKKYKSLKNFE